MTRARELAELGSVYDNSALSNRNIIINGKFEVDQRHGFASHTVTAGSDYFADRWGFYTDANAIAQYGATTEVVADAPSGFVKSLKWTTTSAGTIPATSEVLFRQKIEGYNISKVDYGSSSAKNLTLSFYVKSSIAGDYGFTCWFTDSGSTNRYNLRSYTVNSANTWEYKTISIPPNTANVMGNKTNTDGMHLNWDLGEGTTYSGSVTGNWQSTYVNGLTGGVKIADNNGATWQITGVQLEVGTEATPFEHRSYGDELLRCKRYYEEISGGSDAFTFSAKGQGSTSADATINLAVPLRASPTISSLNSRAFGDSGTFDASSSTTPTVSQFSANNSVVVINCGGFDALTNNKIVNWGPVGNALKIDAEL